MTLRKPLVLNNGEREQLQAGDTLDALVDVFLMDNGNASPIVVGQPVYVSGDDEVDLAQADDQATVQVLGLVRSSSIAAGQPGEVQSDGILEASTSAWDAVTGDSGGLDFGEAYYLDAASPGGLTKTAPTTPGEFVVRVGLALSDEKLLIRIEPPIKL